VTDPDRYPSEIFWSDEDEGFIAVARDLPGCSAFGATREEACAELRPAIMAWIEAAQSAGNPVPTPSEKPAYSGKVLVRMPKSLHEDLAKQAETEGVSLNQYMVVLLSERHATRGYERVWNWQPIIAGGTAAIAAAAIAIGAKSTTGIEIRRFGAFSSPEMIVHPRQPQSRGLERYHG
jgi:antitoxin HicB